MAQLVLARVTCPACKAVNDHVAELGGFISLSHPSPPTPRKHRSDTSSRNIQNPREFDSAHPRVFNKANLIFCELGRRIFLTASTDSYSWTATTAQPCSVRMGNVFRIGNPLEVFTAVIRLITILVVRDMTRRPNSVVGRCDQMMKPNVITMDTNSSVPDAIMANCGVEPNSAKVAHLNVGVAFWRSPFFCGKFFWGKLRLHRKLNPFGVMRSAVCAVRPPFRICILPKLSLKLQPYGY